MSVTEVVSALGSWELSLVEETPDAVLDQLGFYGHIAIADGPVDVEAVGDGLLTGARYVGVLLDRDRETARELSGSALVWWLGDEDGKGQVLEAGVTLTGATFVQAVTAVLDQVDAVTIGTIHTIAGTYTGTHQLQSPREALSIICDAFGAEFRVNGDWSVDAGTPAQLYNTEAPDTIILRRGAGTDLDLVALGGDYDVTESVRDNSTRVVLVGQKVGMGEEPDEVFAVGSADAAVVPYADPQGNPLQRTRLISESSQTTGSVDARAQLQLNRFNRVVRSLKVTAEEFENAGDRPVGDNVWVYDPESGIVDPANEVTFRGEVLHPDTVRVTGATWHLVQGMTVGFRTMAGAWVDLTPFVTWESGANELTVGDLPKTLTRASESLVQVRLDAARPDASVPGPPTGLTLATFSFLDAQGRDVAVVTADWTAPTLNTDGTAITDLSHYLVHYRPTFRAPQWDSRYTDDTTIELPAVIDLDYDVEVAAVDRAGNIGAFTAIQTITAAADSTAPPPPADPVVSSYYGQLRIEYAGTDHLGAPMPSDTNRVDVHVGTTAGFTATAATRVDSITPFAKGVSYATAPYGSARYVKLIAVDHAGNPSSPSTAVSGATVQVADGDVASLSVGKLTAGVLNADVTVAGRFTTAQFGARREMNAIGFQAFDATEALTINLDGVNNLLTGVFKTALAGRRIEIGAGGSTGEVVFLSPDGKRGRIQGFTVTAGDPGTESIRMGVAPSDPTIAPGWGSVSIEGDGTDQSEIWTRAAYHGNIFGGDGPEGLKAWTVWHATNRGTPTSGSARVQRMRIEPDGHFYVKEKNGVDVYRYNDTATVKTHTFRSSDGLTIGARMELGRAFAINVSATMRLLTDAQTNGLSYGGVYKWVMDTNLTNPRHEFKNLADTSFEPVWASAFTVSSDAAGKTRIRDLGGDPLALVRQMRPRRFARSGVSGRDEEDRVAGRGAETEHIGIVAQEAPAELVVGTEDSGLGIDLAAWLAVHTGAIQKLADIVDGLRGGRAA